MEAERDDPDEDEGREDFVHLAEEAGEGAVIAADLTPVQAGIEGK